MGSPASIPTTSGTWPEMSASWSIRSGHLLLRLRCAEPKDQRHLPVDATNAVRTETYSYDSAGNLALYKNPADQYNTSTSPILTIHGTVAAYSVESLQHHRVR